MATTTHSLNTSTDAPLNGPQESTSIIIHYQEPFLEFDPISELSFEDQSKIYCSLVALVKAEQPFDNILLDKAAQFLKSLEPDWNQEIYADRLVTELVPSSNGSPPGFIDSILTLLSSPHSTVVAAAMSFLIRTTIESSQTIRCRLVESDIVTKVIATLQPHTMPISGNRAIFSKFVKIIFFCLQLANPFPLSKLGIIEAVDRFNHREMIFQNVLLPSSQFVVFLITNRFIFDGDLFRSFMSLLVTHIRICPYHRPTLDYVLASPIVMAFSSCLSFVEDDGYLWVTLVDLVESLIEWEEDGPEVAQSGKRMMEALFSEGFEHTLEQRVKHDKDAIHDLFEQAACIGPCRHILTFVHVAVFVVHHFQHNQTSLELHCCHFLMLNRSSMEHGWIGLPFFCPADSLSCFSEHELFFTELDGIDLEQRPIRIPIKSPLIIKYKDEPFLSFDENSELSFQDKSTIYCSLVDLVKAEYPFDYALQDRAAQFLKSLEPKRYDNALADTFVTDLVPSSARSPSEFVDSILTLLSSPHSTVIAAALSFLTDTTRESSPAIRCCLVESDLVTKVLATIQPHTPPISGNETIINHLIGIIERCVNLADPSSLFNLGISDAADAFNHREMVFQKVVLPSSQLMTFLISDRYLLNQDLLDSFTILLSVHISMGPFHRPALEYVLASPIVMAFSSCLSFVEGNYDLWFTLVDINNSLDDWKKLGPEAVKCGKRIIQDLFSEGFEDTLEQMMMNNKGGRDGFRLVDECLKLSELLGSNVEITDDMYLE
ncbi:hypothetical protein BLNAU_23159 [Blattamonas nauphoetae]|uniref:Uncharacterized protein n=1 Tax=Blattamonas nauphoetae TaxID=2049346 RepID=A0ABQ9WRG7_9EUKA|nr:hypothetical protein BLNAU_23159 [Blattamonas nauphoetae]